MEKKTEQIHPDQWLKDLPTELKTFSAEAMISCDKCGRVSPPTRLKCLYCGAQLKVSAEQASHLKPALRKMEDWEKGFNVILQSYSDNSESLPEIAELLHLETDDLQKIFAANFSLPLARAETATEADVIAKRLDQLGVRSKIISDEDLHIEKLPRRLRGMDFAEDALILILFNADEVVRIPYSEIKLVVTGIFFERKIEATESLKKKDEKKILDSRELSSDEMLIDIYSQKDLIGYRIEPKGFDFSCLGAEKGWFAKENMPKLAKKLRTVAVSADFNENYLKIREEIGKVWNISEKNDAGNLARKGLGGVKRTNVTTISNLLQFTRYSRLQWHNL
jgi:hypothetical protein